jgi:hypothetical protein
MERPRDHTSALTVYEVKASSRFDEGEDPFIRSGCATKEGINDQTDDMIDNVAEK